MLLIKWHDRLISPIIRIPAYLSNARPTYSSSCRKGFSCLTRGVTERGGSTARKAARLTHRLPAFSRRQMLQPNEVDLNKLIRGFAEMLERVIGENIQLQLDLCSGLATVLADGNAVEQALMNLAVNARDAMHEGGTLRFETSPVEVDGYYCQTHREAKPGNHVRKALDGAK